MDSNELTVAVLREIRDELDQTNARLDQTNAGLAQTNLRLDQTNTRLDRLERRQVESETRLATEVIAVTDAVRQVKELARTAGARPRQAE